jgi:two-component Ni(II)/redox sensor kinase NrsS
LAGLSLLVMGTLLYGAGLTMGRLLVQTKEAAIRRELETLAGTLHDSLKPVLPREAQPSSALAASLPGLCLARQRCRPPETLMDPHTISASDPERFQLRVLDADGELMAASPGALPLGAAALPTGWTLTTTRAGERWGTYTIHLHHAHGPGERTWGYLQISRSLSDLDAEREQLWWLGHGVFALAMLGMALASWWLAGLAMAPLLEAYRRQEQFNSDVAHELRTPLANLLALVEAGRAETEADSRALANLNRVLAQGQRLQRLIADLLLLASLEQAPCPQALEPCRIAESLEDLIEEFSETARIRGVTLTLQCSDPDLMVPGRATELLRLLSNLLSNAIQHSPPRGLVRVALHREGSELHLAVSDQGPGITSSEQKRIFERFYRSDSSRSRGTGGTGLGLAIAQAIVRRHRGRLTVQSTPGVGSTFILQLPVLA